MPIILYQLKGFTELQDLTLDLNGSDQGVLDVLSALEHIAPSIHSLKALSSLNHQVRVHHLLIVGGMFGHVSNSIEFLKWAGPHVGTACTNNWHMDNWQMFFSTIASLKKLKKLVMPDLEQDVNCVADLRNLLDLKEIAVDQVTDSEAFSKVVLPRVKFVTIERSEEVDGS